MDASEEIASPSLKAPSLMSKTVRGVPFPVIIVLASAVVVSTLWLLKSSMTTCSCGSRVQRVRTDLNALTSALKMYRQNTGELPSQGQGLEALVDHPTDPAPKNWTKLMDKVPEDPWNHPYAYLRDDRYPGGYGLYSMGKDGVSHTNGNDQDDIASWNH